MIHGWVAQWIKGPPPFNTIISFTCCAHQHRVQMNSRLSSVGWILFFALWLLTVSLWNPDPECWFSVREGSVWLLLQLCLLWLCVHKELGPASGFGLPCSYQGKDECLWISEVGRAWARGWLTQVSSKAGSKVRWSLFFRLMPNPPTRVLGVFIQCVVDNGGKNSHFPRWPRQEARLTEKLVWNTREHQRTSWSPADALTRDSWKAEMGMV